jgi:hypothetical protein
MKFFLAILILFSFSFVYAGEERLIIEKIDLGRSSNERDHLYFSDGRVGVITSKSGRDILIKEDIGVGSTVEVKLDKNHNVLSLLKVEDSTSKDKIDFKSFKEKEVLSHYQPTILPNMDTVNNIFRRMNRRWQRRSQCYNRAHVWNYEEFKNSGLKSKKVFIFYTRKYIREYNFNWWFHAIPTVLVNHEGSVVERALDPMFAKKPLPLKTWSDLFIRSKRECPVITKYSTYENNQESEHCYLHYSSMYYWQPRDLDKFERTGYEKDSFIRSEVNHAYWEAF